jgi:hypothetical protein
MDRGGSDRARSWRGNARYLRIIVGNLKVGRKQLQLLGVALLVKDLDAFQPPGLRRAVQLP